ELGPLVYYSSDYVFDGAKRSPYVESEAPNPLSAYGRSKAYGEAAAGERAWIVRSSWLFGPTGRNFVRTMLRLGAERDEVSVVDDQVGCPTYVAHLAAATRKVVELPHGIWHLAADGECTWAEFAQAIFEEAKLAGRAAGRPSSAVVIDTTRHSSFASSKIACANSAQVHSPSAARCQIPWGSSTISRVAAARCPT